MNTVTSNIINFQEAKLKKSKVIDNGVPSLEEYLTYRKIFINQLDNVKKTLKLTEDSLKYSNKQKISKAELESYFTIKMMFLSTLDLICQSDEKFKKVYPNGEIPELEKIIF